MRTIITTSAIISTLILSITSAVEGYELIRFSSSSGNRCVGVSGSGTGTDLELFTCDSNDDFQMWERDGDLFRLKANNDRCARRNGGEGARIILSDCNSSSNQQQWEYNRNGNNKIRSISNTDLCWESEDTSNFSRIFAEFCSSGSDSRQRFYFGGSSSTTEFLYYRASNSDNSNRCLGVGSANSGAEVRLFSCDSNSNRRWRLNSSQQLVLQADTSYCAQRMGNGAVVQIQSCRGNEPNQRWTFNEDGNGHLRTPNTGQCMEYDNPAISSQIETQNCGSGNSNQRWSRSSNSGDNVNPDSSYKLIRLRDNNSRCLGVETGLFPDIGTLVVVVSCTDSGIQDTYHRWFLDGNRRLRFGGDTSLCAARSSGTSSASNLVRLEACSSSSSDANQRWWYNFNRDEEFQSWIGSNTNSDSLCMQHASDQTASEVTARRCTGDSNQQYLYEGGDPGPEPEDDGFVVFPRKGSPRDDPDCDRCLGVDVVRENAQLIWVGCDTSRTLRWLDYPTASGSRWCVFDDVENDDLCVVPTSSSLSGSSLQLVYASTFTETNSLRLTWFHTFTPAEDYQITNEADRNLCLNINGNNVRLNACSIGAPFQTWDIQDFRDQERVCDQLVNREDGRDPSATSPGQLIYLDDKNDCEQCIAITGCTSANYNCDSARLVVTDCIRGRDDEYLKFWILVPGSRSLWCSRDSFWCVDYAGNPGSNALRLILNPPVNQDNPGQRTVPLRTSQEWDYSFSTISPRVSNQVCVAAQASGGGSAPPVVERCTGQINPKVWSIKDYNTWTRVCDPLGRDPGALSGMFIHVDTDSECGWCIGIDTATNVVGLARCIDDNDNYETSFREGMVPGDRNVWCLDSDPTRCIRNTFPTGTGLTVMIREGNQDELWNYDTNREIQPRATDLTCVVRDRPEASTVVKVEQCSLAGFEYRSWRIVNANAYSCDTLGTSSFAESDSSSATGTTVGQEISFRSTTMLTLLITFATIAFAESL